MLGGNRGTMYMWYGISMLGDDYQHERQIREHSGVVPGLWLYACGMQRGRGETPVEVAWEDNESVEALKGLCQDGPLTIEMSMYGGFEQVGSIGQSLPRADVQMTTQAGDIVLYSGNQMVVFYGSNSWSYTKLGRIGGKSAQELAELLGSGDVTITIKRG